LEGKQQALLTDTVGFIRKLPHNLVDAFRSTLEEARYADYIIHVVDASSESAEDDMRVVYETLDMLKIEGKKVLTVFNKIDKISPETGIDVRGLKDTRAYMTVKMSAKTGEGTEDFLEAVTAMIREDRRRLEKVFSYSEMSAVSEIRDNGLIIKEDYRDDGIYIEADVPARLYGKYNKILPVNY
jgi:GTP-binding protein HflX